MTVREFYRALCAIIPRELGCDWDVDGLNVCPDPDREVKRVLVALDATTEVVDKAVEAALEARKHRRARTLCDFRYVTRRFMKRCPGLTRRRVRSITPAECAAYIEEAFETPRQRQKARLTLSGVFSTAMKCGWCSENPVARVEAPRVVEKTVPILTPEEAEQLVQAAREYKGGICLPAVGLMLYAGILRLAAPGSLRDLLHLLRSLRSKAPDA